MGAHRLRKGLALKVGLGLVAVWFLMTYVLTFGVVVFGTGSSVLILLIGATLGIVGFGLIVASTFLPEGKNEKPTFTQELMGRERLNYGVYTEGNWKAVLDVKDKEDKTRR